MNIESLLDQCDEIVNLYSDKKVVKTNKLVELYNRCEVEGFLHLKLRSLYITVCNRHLNYCDRIWDDFESNFKKIDLDYIGKMQKAIRRCHILRITHRELDVWADQVIGRVLDSCTDGLSAKSMVSIKARAALLGKEFSIKDNKLLDKNIEPIQNIFDRLIFVSMSIEVFTDEEKKKWEKELARLHREYIRTPGSLLISENRVDDHKYRIKTELDRYLNASNGERISSNLDYHSVGSKSGSALQAIQNIDDAITQLAEFFFVEECMKLGIKHKKKKNRDKNKEEAGESR